MRLSENFTLVEFTKSSIAKKNGLENKPSAEATKNIKYLVEQVLQPLRDHLGVPIKVTSGYRSPEVNRIAGGVPSSDHLCNDGTAAADITVEGWKIDDLAREIQKLKLPVEQVIAEFDQGVVHVSTVRPKGEFLQRSLVNGKIMYQVLPPKTSRKRT